MRYSLLFTRVYMDVHFNQRASLATEKETFDLTGTFLNITAVIASPQFKDDPYTTYELDVEVFKAIQLLLNFSYFIKTDDWGTYNESTGKSTGMARRILEAEAHLALTASANIPYLHQVLDFTMTSYTFSYAAIFKKQTFLGDPFALFRPFHWSLWLAVGLWCACVYNAVRAAASLSRRLMSIRIDRDTHIMILPMALLCGKSLPCSTLTAAWYRVMIYTATMSAAVFNAAFSGVLLSFLFVTQESSSLSQLTSLGTFEFAMDPGNAALFEHKLRGALPSDFLALYAQNKKVLISFEARTLPSRILEGNLVALTGEWGAYDFLIERFNPIERSAVAAAILPIGQQQWGCMVTKGSKYKRSIDYAILKSREKGLLDLWQSRFSPQRPTRPSGGTYNPVPVECVYMAISIFCFGFVSSFVVLTIEMCSLRCELYVL